MNFFKNTSSIILAICISFAFASCSNDDDKSSGPAGGTPNPAAALGTVNLTISGDVEGQRSGIADFDIIDLGFMQTWDLNLYDHSPQTFDLSFVHMATDGSGGRPAPGTYEIGNSVSEQKVFWVDYTHIENQDFANSIEYSAMYGQAGTLVITTSNEQLVSGTFEFTAHQYDDDSMEIIGTINVSGSFSAKKRG